MSKLTSEFNKHLKGGKFQNRYRITGELVTKSPLHIGTGIARDDLYSPNEAARLKKKLAKLPEVSTVIKDVNGKPVIPGSALKGVLRHWLFDILHGIGPDWADDNDYSGPEYNDMEQEELAEKVLESFSWLELLFGTPFHEGKVEVWDAECSTPNLVAPDGLLQWNKNSLTYIDTSVAINPATGTALEGLLYKAEVVPPGVTFQVTLTAQNLSDLELGILLFGLEGFNSEIYPITVGARSGRGYGRFSFKVTTVQYLNHEDLGAWVTSQLTSRAQGDDAGYFSLPILNPDERSALIKAAKDMLAASIGDADVQ